MHWTRYDEHIKSDRHNTICSTLNLIRSTASFSSHRGRLLPLPFGVPLREPLHGRLVLHQLQPRAALLPLFPLLLSLRLLKKKNKLSVRHKQGCDRNKYFGSPNQMQNQIRLVLLVLTDTKIWYHLGEKANFVYPNQIQIQIGLVLLVRPRDDMSQPWQIQW